MKIEPLDTVGAGDAFAGTFAAWRAGGADLKKAICYANCAGALTSLKPGAQEPMPNRRATERAWRANSSLSNDSKTKLILQTRGER
jgi:ribokinase